MGMVSFAMGAVMLVGASAMPTAQAPHQTDPAQTPVPGVRVQWNKGGGPADMGRGLPNPPGWYKAAVGRPTKDKVLYVTFDDGPSPQTPRLLKVLKKYEAKATFFVSGGTSTMHRGLLRRMHRQGHAVGNHTWSHAQLTRVPVKTARQQIVRPKRKLKGLLNSCMRPPYGLIDQQVATIALDAGFQPVMWTEHVEDWRQHSLAWTVQRLRSDTRPGAVILLHDTHGQSVTAIQQMLPVWKQKGYELETVPSCREMVE